VTTRTLRAERLAAAKRAHTTRHVVPLHPGDRGDVFLLDDADVTPQAGDLVLARLATLGHHSGLQLTSGRRATLFPSDEVIVAFGARYAPDQFLAEVPVDLSTCHLVAAGGIAGRVVASHTKSAPRPSSSPWGCWPPELTGR
jgi:hypothetical protein